MSPRGYPEDPETWLRHVFFTPTTTSKNVVYEIYRVCKESLSLHLHLDLEQSTIRFTLDEKSTSLFSQAEPDAKPTLILD